MAEPRNRAGYIEETMVLALFGYLSNWAARVVAALHPLLDDADLRGAIQIAGTIAGALFAKWVRDCAGRPLIQPRSSNAPAVDTIALVLAVLLFAGSACAVQLGTVEAPAIDAEGAPVVGAPPVRCRGVTIAVGNAGVGETCAAGGELSEMGSSFLVQLLSPLAWLARLAAPGA